MRSAVRAMGLVGVAALLFGCGAKSSAPTINASMTGVMEPQAQAAWDVASNAYNEKGDGLVAAKISAADWQVVAKAGQQIRDRALILANAEHVIVAGPDEAILGSQAVGIKGKIGKAWDAASAKQVQKRIDANPTLFAQHARDLADAGDTLVKAASSKDVDLFYKVTSGMDETCDGCHEPFWGTDEPPPLPLTSPHLRNVPQ